MHSRARTHARAHARTHTRTHAHTHTRTHSRTHARPHARAHHVRDRPFCPVEVPCACGARRACRRAFSSRAPISSARDTRVSGGRTSENPSGCRNTLKHMHARTHARTHFRTHRQPDNRARAHTHTHTHTRAHTDTALTHHEHIHAPVYGPKPGRDMQVEAVMDSWKSGGVGASSFTTKVG